MLCIFCNSRKGRGGVLRICIYEYLPTTTEGKNYGSGTSSKGDSGGEEEKVFQREEQYIRHFYSTNYFETKKEMNRKFINKTKI